MTAAPDSFTVRPGPPLHGELAVPGDKSISHRALLLSALAQGTTHIEGFLPGEDCLATARIIRQLGAQVEHLDDTHLRVTGTGVLQEPAAALDCGNSGTAMRLLAGVLAAQPFASRLTGDDSLLRRPMDRIMAPLAQMGAQITAQDGHGPLDIRGRSPLRHIDYTSPVASAQVKSAVLLAGLAADGPVIVREAVPSRDHTERMLRAFGARIDIRGGVITLQPGSLRSPGRIHVPGDLSSAAFFLVAAAATPGARVVLRGVGLNPTRAGVLQILRRMGAEVTTESLSAAGDEPRADIMVRGAGLRGIDIPPELVPSAIDEFPAVLACAALAEGVTTLRGAGELRVKESDRLAVVAAGLQALGVETESGADGIRVTGGRLTGGIVDAVGDHRIAMAFALAARAAADPVTILNTRQVDTSFPDFIPAARQLGLDIS